MRAEFAIAAVVIGLAVVGMIAMSIAYWNAQADRNKAQSIESIVKRHQEIVEAIGMLNKRQDVVDSQNQWSAEDRQWLHENQKEIREALKRLEARK